MGSFLWPIAVPFLICAIALPCMALICSEERPKRILNAFSALCNGLLAAYLGIIPLVRERNIPFVTILIIVLATFAAAISAVILAFFDGHGAVAATKFIPLLLVAAQNYMFATVRGARNLREGNFMVGQAVDSCIGVLVG